MKSTRWMIICSAICFSQQGQACPAIDLDLDFANTPYSGANGMRYLESSNEIVFKDRDGSSQAMSFKNGKWCLRKIAAPGAIQEKAGAAKPPTCFEPQEFSHTDNASNKEISRMAISGEQMKIKFGENQDSIAIVPKGDGFQLVLNQKGKTSRLDLKKRGGGSKGLNAAVAPSKAGKKVVVGQNPGEAISSEGCGVIKNQAAAQPEYIDPEGEGPNFEHALGAGKGSGKAGR